MKKFIENIFSKNPIFVLALGLCPALAVSKTLEQAFIMGISVFIILLISSLLISIIKKLIPKNVELIVYILIISTIVTIIDMLLGKYVPLISKTLGIYLPLIIVNCLILGRSLTIYSKKGIKESLADSISIGVGFLLGISVLGFLRELLGTNTITIINDLSPLFNFKLVISNIIPSNILFPNVLFTTAAGGFILMGLILGIVNSIKGRGAKKNETNSTTIN